jgi:S1-C subfamily serine protease
VTVLEKLSGELTELVARTTPAVVGVEMGQGQGSGLVLAPDGYVLTNRHVVRGGRPKVRFAGGATTRAEVVGHDAPTDLAVLRVPERDLPVLPLAEKPLQVGQLVVAIGNPLRFERSVSLGVISALDRSLPGGRGVVLEGLIQTDAAINPGNSGGPLVDAGGHVAGINTAIIPWAQGIGFAIPARTASWVAAHLIQHGEIRRPLLGISARAEPLPPALAGELAQARAVRVMGVGEGSPAERAGLLRGDLLLAAAGAAVGSVDDLQRALVHGGEREIAIDVLRGSERRIVTARPTHPSARAA